MYAQGVVYAGSVPPLRLSPIVKLLEELRHARA